MKTLNSKITYNMKVERFKLNDEGIAGISVWGKDSKQKGNYLVYVDASLTFKVPLPKEITAKIQRLKIFFLQLTGYWENKFAAFLDEVYNLKDLPEKSDSYLRAVQLFEQCFVTGLKHDDGYFIITGKMKNTYGQTIGMSTPKTSHDTQFPGYDRMATLAHEVVGTVENYVNDRQLQMMDSKQYALELFKDGTEEDKASIEAMTEEELDDMKIEHLTRQGHIVIRKEDMEDNIEEEKESAFVEESGDGMKPSPDEVLDGKAKEVKDEDKSFPAAPPASNAQRRELADEKKAEAKYEDEKDEAIEEMSEKNPTEDF